MPFLTELDSTQLENLRGTSLIPPTYAASEYTIFIQGELVFKTTLSATPTGTSYAQVSFGATISGDPADVIANMTVLISATDDMRTAIFVGRARDVITGSVLKINETSEALLIGYYVYVLRDFRLFDRLARLVSNVQKKDYEISYRLPSPAIIGLQSAYAGVCSGTPEVLTLSFAPTGLAIASGATINNSSWVWSIPSGATITVGSTTTQNITVEFDVGFKDWVTVQVNDSNGNTGFFHFAVGAVPSDFSDVVTLAVKGATLSCDENGWTGSIAAFSDVDELIDNTLVIIFDVELYNGDETNINGNVKFVGRLRKESNQTTSDEIYSQLKSATYDLEGALAQFGRVEHLPFTLIDKASPTAFDQITNLTMWRAIAYTLYWHSTFLELFALTFDSTDTTFRYLALPTQGGNILAVINDLAVSINATLESAPTGETRVYRNAVYETSGQRAALVTVMDGTTQDYINIDSLEIEEVDTSGKIQASGGFYNSVSGKVTPLLSLAPGVAQGIGEGIGTFGRQVLAANVTQAVAQAELNTRCGHEYEVKRRNGVFLNLTLPPGYNFLIPSRSQWYTWTLAADDTTGGRAYTSATRWQLFSVQIQQDNDIGTKTVQATFKQETSGNPGQTVTYPPQTQITPKLPTIPVLPPFPSFPPLPTINLPADPTIDDTPPYIGSPAISNGNLVALWTARTWNAPDLWLTNTPSWSEITPDTDYTDTCFQWVRLGSKGGYNLANNGTDSQFNFAEDATSPGAICTPTALSDLYTLIRAASVAGSVFVYGDGTESNTLDFDFTIDDQGWTVLTVGAPVGTYTPGVGWTQTDAPGDSDPANEYQGVAIGYVPLSGVTVTHFSVTYSIVNGVIDATLNNFIATDGTGSVRLDTNPQPATGNGTFTLEYTGSVAGITEPITQIFCGFRNGSNTAPGGTVVITEAHITYTTAAQVNVQYSPDYGETFGGALSVGDTPGAFGGFDTQKVGAVSLAGADGQVYRATTLGGTYTAYGDPMPTGAQPSCIIIPRYKSSGAANSGSSPDYIVYSSVLTAGNEAAWYVSAGGTVFTNITKTIGGEYGVAVSPNCADACYKLYNRYAAVLLFGTEVHLITSVNNGTAWTDRGQIADDANYIRYRPSDATGNQLFIANGTDGIIVSPSHGSNLITTKSVPSSDQIIGLEPF